MSKNRKHKARAYGAKVRAAAAAQADTQAWILRASRGGTRPCLQVVRCHDGDALFRFGLDPMEERPCPRCADWERGILEYWTTPCSRQTPAPACATA